MTEAEKRARAKWQQNQHSIENLVDCFVICAGDYAAGDKEFVEAYRSPIYKTFGPAYKEYLRVVQLYEFTIIDYYDELGAIQGFCEINPWLPYNENFV